MRKLNSARILLVGALFILALTFLSYAEEIFVISDIKEFAREYVKAIRALQIENPEAIPIFQGEIVAGLENGWIIFKNEREDIRAEIKAMKDTKAQALNTSEAADRLFTLKESNKELERGADVMRNASSDNNDLGDKKDGGGDGDQGSMKRPSTP